MEGSKVSEAKLVVYVHPSKTKIISDAITRELSSLLFKFNESFDGIMLAYEVIDIESKRAKILPGLFPYLCVNLRANLLLFNPKPNMYLEGKVVKVTRESIHLIVLGFAAAVITEEDIRDEFKFKVKHDQEIFRSKSNRRHAIKVGRVIRFTVKSFNEEVLHISGSLAPQNTGCIQWLDRSLEEAFSVSRSSKKRKESWGNRETRDQVSDFVDHGALSVDSHVVKKSKRRNGEEAY
ncbi:hypothetical protein V2J09_018115 [Rumex salicifolius]